MASNGRNLIAPLAFMALFWVIGITLYLIRGHWFFLFNFGYIGTSVGLGLGLYASLPRSLKDKGRMSALFLVGGYMLGVLGLLSHENMQLEGLFFYLLTGFFCAATIHYIIAKIVGPVLFGRAWCGWACWTAMVLDLLPFKRSSGRINPIWGRFRYLHFALSLGLALVLWYIFGYGAIYVRGSLAEYYWLLAGNIFYYAVAIGLAYRFGDNRAFCKYVCPITVFLKLGSHIALTRIKGDAGLCTGCAACSRVCPMDIEVHDYIQAGQRVLSTECILCQRCVNSCPQKALDVSWALDYSKRECLRTSDSGVEASFCWVKQ